MIKIRPVDIGVITAVTAITILEIVALLHGINGQAFLTSISLIAGLAGFRLGQWQTRRNEEKNTPEP